MEQMDALEERLQHKCTQARRRMQLLLLEATESRRSHVRLSIHHSYQPEITAAGAMAALMQKPVLGGTPSLPCKPSPPIWTCHVEGKLLIDFLDYASAQRYDARDKEKSDQKSTNAPPTKFTHWFHKVSVTYQTIYEPLDPAKGGGGLKAKKKSRRTSNIGMDPPSEEPSDTCKSPLHNIVWTLPGPNDPPSTGADLWSFAYPEPTNPDKSKWKVQSVVAVLELFRRYQYSSNNTSSKTDTAANARYYRITSSALQKALFPHHGPVTTDVLTGVALPTASHAAMLEHLLGSTHNQVHIPSVLTMTDIVMTFFTYIQDRRLILMDHGAGDVVQCDKTLQNLFHMEQFSFSQLRNLLHQRQLIEPASTDSIYDPVRITYVMDQEGASPSLVPWLKSPSPPVVESTAPRSCLQLDMDIWVPTIFSSRVATLLRRVAPREAEALSARSAARTRWARRADEDPVVRARMEQWFQQQQQSGMAPGEAIPWIPLALAQSAPWNSEAQWGYQCDAPIDFLLAQLEAKLPICQQAHKAMKACQQWNTNL